MELISELKTRILEGGQITADEAYLLGESIDAPGARQQLRDAAAEITRAFAPRKFDSCSIINARSGRCREDCRWCAQSAHYHTSADVYPLVGRGRCMASAEASAEAGIGRFSLVTSGRAMTGADLETACDYYRQMATETGLGLCASMGLMTRDDLQRLHEAGVTRYHCNLETAPSMFPKLCSTHSLDDKLRTIGWARELGMEVCSGGIIGMGETRRQRIEFALKLREIEPVSIPVNILCPIPGTPLAGAEPIAADDVIDTVALFRLIHPHAALRFAGGREQLSRETQLEAMRVGINGAIVGDLLTTIGSKVADDRKLVSEAGYEF